jgi:4-amino-4-deoxy-L-arabinose transferase-like glycosyltransferase
VTKNKTQTGLNFFLIFLVFLSRLLLTKNPSLLYFHGDEAIISQNALNMFKEGIQEAKWDFFGSGKGTLCFFPAPWYYLQGAIIYFLGPSLFSIKLLSLFTDFGIALLLYLIVKNNFHRKINTTVIPLYLTFPISIHFSLTGYQNLQSTFFLLLTFFFLTQKRIKASLSLIAAGISAGLGMYFYHSSFIIPLLSLVFIFYLHRKWPRRLARSIFFFLLSFALIAAPFFHYSLTEYNFLTSRSSSFSLSTDTAVTLQEIFINQTSRFFKGFYGGVMNGSGLHYVDLPLFPNLLIFSFFLLGFFYALINWKKKECFFILLIFLATSLSAGLLTEAPPAAQRLIHLFPLSMIFVALGADQTFTFFKTKNSHRLVVIFSLSPLNLFSFINQNIPQNQVSLGPEYSFSQYYRQHSYHYPVYVHLPPHMFSRIFFYSEGQIKPLKHFSFLDPQTALFITDQTDDELSDQGLSPQLALQDWSYQDKYQTTYRLFLVDNFP